MESYQFAAKFGYGNKLFLNNLLHVELSRPGAGCLSKALGYSRS